MLLPAKIPLENPRHNPCNSPISVPKVGQPAKLKAVHTLPTGQHCAHAMHSVQRLVAAGQRCALRTVQVPSGHWRSQMVGPGHRSHCLLGPIFYLFDPDFWPHFGPYYPYKFQKIFGNETSDFEPCSDPFDPYKKFRF